MTKLSNYLDRLETILERRSDITIESLYIRATSRSGLFTAEIRFFDGSRLSLTEHLENVRKKSPKRLRYKFHYQSASGDLIFRYDNSPHHPHLRTHPHHKHIGQHVTDSTPPDLTNVLAEIDELLYGASG